MNNEAARVRVTDKIFFEALQIARAGVIDVQLLMREQVDGYCWLTL